mmetsp:Transcript_24741/g.62089  ORF Transcript_24741/g.62089 Transcript_24741/m.62089 type:complete len:212 (-) Transcript_24741:26-661(-)
MDPIARPVPSVCGYLERESHLHLLPLLPRWKRRYFRFRRVPPHFRLVLGEYAHEHKTSSSRDYELDGARLYLEEGCAEERLEPVSAPESVAVDVVEAIVEQPCVFCVETADGAQLRLRAQSAQSAEPWLKALAEYTLRHREPVQFVREGTVSEVAASAQTQARLEQVSTEELSTPPAEPLRLLHVPHNDASAEKLGLKHHPRPAHTTSKFF